MRLGIYGCASETPGPWNGGDLLIQEGGKRLATHCLRQGTFDEVVDLDEKWDEMRFLKELAKCSAVIIVGRPLLTKPSYGWTKRPHSRIELIRKSETPYAFWATGAGENVPDHTPLRYAQTWDGDDLKWVRILLSGATFITTRDWAAQALVRRIGLQSEIVGCPSIIAAERQSRDILADRCLIIPDCHRGTKSEHWRFAMVAKQWADKNGVESYAIQLPDIPSYGKYHELCRSRFIISNRMHPYLLALSYGATGAMCCVDARETMPVLYGCPPATSFRDVKDADDIDSIMHQINYGAVVKRRGQSISLMTTCLSMLAARAKA